METPQKSTSETFLGLWEQLSNTQRKFAVAMLSTATKKEAAEAIGIEPNTAYKFNGQVDVVIEFMRADMYASALGIIQSNAAKAAMVKAKGLDSENEKIRQDAASEILDRMLGKATQKKEVNHSGKVERIHTVDFGLDDDSDD